MVVQGGAETFIHPLETRDITIKQRYYMLVIVGFRDADTEMLWNTGKSRRIPATIRRSAARKLMVLNAALELSNLTVPPGNRLEALAGNRKGQYSIRVNDQYRICFAWEAGNAHDVAFAIHPGEILKEEFMVPLSLTSYRIAKDLHVPGPRINDIVRGKRAITADTAIRLGIYFGLPAQFWMNLQTDYDLRLATAASSVENVRPRQAA
jgi:addiction module HigA family antidote